MTDVERNRRIGFEPMDGDASKGRHRVCDAYTATIVTSIFPRVALE
jgi:hypothetical protein